MNNRNKNRVFEQVEVVDIASKGKAVAKTNEGVTIFIPSGAVPGDIIDVNIHKKRRGYYEGSIAKIHKYSEHRENPVCEHFGVCGGCKWQHMKYSSQLLFKQNEITENLKRIGGVNLTTKNPILACEKPYFYRNKMEFSFSNKRWLTQEEINSETQINRNALGLHKPGMWDKVVDISTCHLQNDPSNAIRNFIREYALEHTLEFFDPKTQKGFLRSLTIRITSTQEVMVALQVFKNEPALFPLLNAIAKEFPNINSIQYVINNKANDTIYDQEIICFKGENYITEVMEDLKFKITLKSFYQTNSLQALNLYKIVCKLAKLQKNDIVYDLYTGTGTIAQFIAKYVTKVVGIDLVSESIEIAKSNSIDNQIDNVFFEAGDMKIVFKEDFINNHGKASVVITDPPRDGMHKDVIKQLINLAPKKIVYVSCNSATQAKDIALMKEYYKLVDYQAVDMFPQTHHTENVVLLEKYSN